MKSSAAPGRAPEARRSARASPISQFWKFPSPLETAWRDFDFSLGLKCAARIPPSRSFFSDFAATTHGCTVDNVPLTCTWEKILCI
ncbi:hypothetical protein NL676_003455 [Syzygium grande]|nr:hypothetical protein NL676_003455 [Syzygium grande]